MSQTELAPLVATVALRPKAAAAVPGAPPERLEVLAEPAVRQTVVKASLVAAAELLKGQAAAGMPV